MAILAGIDEAGYGPLLGPLVVSGVAFRVPDAHLDRCLWKSLSRTCAPAGKGARRRLIVADSKKLYSTQGSIAPLERAALVMLAAAGYTPEDFKQLLEVVAPAATSGLRAYPWYADAAVTLPLSEGVGDIATRANAVRLNCAECGIEPVGIRCEPLLEGDYNRLVKSTRNKAVVLLGLALRIVDWVIRKSPGQRVRLCVDRLGGRRHYRESLSTALPQYSLQILEESPVRSSYRLIRASQVCDIEFVTSGESHHFAIALASIYSKYMRELYMHLFNQYWAKQDHRLRPTAGYYRDAQRWLKEASPLLDRLNIERTTLVRDR